MAIGHINRVATGDPINKNMSGGLPGQKSGCDNEVNISVRRQIRSGYENTAFRAGFLWVFSNNNTDKSYSFFRSESAKMLANQPTSLKPFFEL